jgi:hypothetical protein
MYLGDLISQHISIIIVRSHAEAPLGPSDDLHGGSIRDQVLMMIMMMMMMFTSDYNMAKGFIINISYVEQINPACKA